MMGSGKTTIGRMLAKRLGRRFIDSDQEIEARTGVRVPVIFEIEGEGGFRKREAEVIESLSLESGLVMATGGGAVLNPDSRDVLRQRGFVVYLDVPPKVLFERTRHDRNRPLLHVPDPLARLESIHAERDALYRNVADLVVNGCIGAKAVVAVIEQALLEHPCAA
jgi:shikimate kinase